MKTYYAVFFNPKGSVQFLYLAAIITPQESNQVVGLNIGDGQFHLGQAQSDEEFAEMDKLTWTIKSVGTVERRFHPVYVI